MKTDFSELEQKCRKMRREIVQVVGRVRSSHIGSMFSCLDLVAYLYLCELNFSKKNMNNPDRDRFILSKGHASLAVYVVLAEMGIIPSVDIQKFYADDTHLIGHLNHKVPGVEASTGSLGHGLPMAAGIALGNKLDQRKARTVCIIGDGECDEGSIWESFIWIAQQELKNLIIIVDANRLQGYPIRTMDAKLAMVKQMLKAMPFNYYEIDGHNFHQMHDTFQKIAKHTNTKSTIIYANTVKGKGVSYMEGKLEWHYKSPNEDQTKQALGELK